MITYKNLQFAHSASNNDNNYSDLEFVKDGISHIFQNVEAPEDWDGESDWTEDEEYVMNAIKSMKVYSDDDGKQWYK